MHWFRKAAALAVVMIASGAQAEVARFHDLEGFGVWLDGNPETTTITEDGAVALGPPIRERYADAAASFSAATAWGNDVVLARVDDGQVFRVDRAGKTKDIYKPTESLVTAVAARKKYLYIAAGPPAKVYRVAADGKATAYYQPDAAYIWDMVVADDGTLYLATGEPGTVVRVGGANSGEVVFKSEQDHLRSIAYDRKLGLFVGGGERAIVYRASEPASKKPSFKALYDSGLTEVTGLLTRNDAVFASAVTGAQAVAGDGDNEERGKGLEVRSQVVAVNMDGSSNILAGSSDEAVFALGLDDKRRVLVATGATGREDPRGRIYAVDPEARLISMMYQSPSKRITHLVPLPREALAAVSGAGGRVVHVAGGYARTGEFFTEPFDSTINARYGMLQVFGQFPKGTSATAAVRTGQTSTPDATWSDWSAEVTAPGQVRPEVSNGRYAQLRLTLRGDGKQTPEVYRARLAYLRQNLPPFVREVVALRKGIALLPLVREESKSKTISLAEKAKADARKPQGPQESNGSKRARQVEQTGALTVKWVAEDPNGDDLQYDLQVRGDGEPSWRTMGRELEDPFYTFHASQLPDGHYRFRVRATDAPSNPDGLEETDVRESRAVLVDNTPPVVERPEVRVRGRGAVTRAEVRDNVGPLIDAAYSLDGARFRPLLPDDGVLDGPGESFTLKLTNLEPGRHTLTVRVTDEAGNSGTGEARFNVR